MAVTSGIQRPTRPGAPKPAAPTPPTQFAPNPTAPAPQPPAQPGGSTPYPATPGTFTNNPGGQTPTGTKYDIDPTGRMTPYTPFASGPGETSWRPGESTDLFDLNMQRMMAMLKQFGMVGGPQGPLPREVAPPAPGREVPSTMADRTAAESAEFGRAKDRIGKIGGSALATLRDRSTATGRSGSGLEKLDEQAIIEGTAGELGQVVRDQAIDRLDRHDEIDDRNLATGVAQRGQDLSTRAGDLGANIQQRGQDYNALLNPYQNPLMSSIPSLFGMFMPRLY